jgi:AcrR family transcriptional regulator
MQKDMATTRQTKANDPAERRDEVLRATWRVIAREGLDRASMRAIAQELGSTTGVLTHYFRDKDALLDFVLASMAESLDGTWTPLVGTTPTVPWVIDHLVEVLPRNARLIDSWKVWLSFTVAAFSRRRQSMDHAAFYAGLRQKWAIVLRELQQRGEIRADLDPQMEAELLLCLIDGLGVQGAISPKHLPGKRQRALLEAYFAKLAAP